MRPMVNLLFSGGGGVGTGLTGARNGLTRRPLVKFVAPVLNCINGDDD